MENLNYSYSLTQFPTRLNLISSEAVPLSILLEFLAPHPGLFYTVNLLSCYVVIVQCLSDPETLPFSSVRSVLSQPNYVMLRHSRLYFSGENVNLEISHRMALTNDFALFWDVRLNCRGLMLYTSPQGFILTHPDEIAQSC